MLKHFEQFVFRTPLLPFSDLDLRNFKKNFKEIVRQPVFQEAIFLSSRSLYEKIVRFINGDLKEKEYRKLLISCAKYYIRLHTRCTPFGIFSGLGVGSINENINRIELKGLEHHKTDTKIDLGYLLNVLDKISIDEKFNSKLEISLSTGAYPLGSNIRYTEFKYRNNNRVYFLSNIKVDEILKELISAIQEGPLHFDRLVGILESAGFDRHVSSDFINEIIASQLFVTNISPSITGEKMLDQIIDNLNENGFSDLSKIFETISNELEKIDSKPLGRNLSSYLNLSNNLTKQIKPNATDNWFQVDTFLETSQASLSQGLIDEVKRSILFLNSITPRIENSNLSTFRDEFLYRYEDEEIPLTIALDSDVGIGFPVDLNQKNDINPFLDNLGIRLNNESNASHPRIFNPDFDVLLQKKFNESYQNSKEFELNFSDYEIDPNLLNDIPATISAHIEIIDEKRNEIILKNCGGTSGANLLTRFCHGQSDLRGLVSKVIEVEDLCLNENEITAEICHIPQDRVGNILQRPKFRRYEINYLSNPTSSQVDIPISDMLISVRGDKIILRSKKLNKVIKPYLTSAHNFTANSLPIYNFLCTMQGQGQCINFIFPWSYAFQQLEYLPRVKYNNVILHPSRWKIKVENNYKIDELIKEKFVANEVLLVYGDNKLYLNLEIPFCRELLDNELQSKKEVVLEEFLFRNVSKNLVTNGNRIFTNEIIIPFYKADD